MVVSWIYVELLQEAANQKKAGLNWEGKKLRWFFLAMEEPEG